MGDHIPAVVQDLVWYPSKMPRIYMLIRWEDYGGDLPRISWVTPDNYTQDLSNPAINFYLGRPPTLFNHPYRFRLKSIPLKSYIFEQ